MHALDWAIVVGYVAWLVWDGVKRTRLERTTESFFLANRSLPWWAVGLSVMATQSAPSRSSGPLGRATRTACASCSSISGCRSR
jgi:Na+/proline symporter